MNDLTLEHDGAQMTCNELHQGVIIKITANGDPQEIWLDQRGISRLYAFLRDVMPDTEEGLNGIDY